MITIDFEKSKSDLNNLIDKLLKEVITDFLREIKTCAEQENIRDIELNIESIRDLEKSAFELKRNITKSENIQQVFSYLNCQIFFDVDELVLSTFFDTEVKIKK